MVGPQAEWLSASTVTRLKQVCEQEYDAWSRHSLEAKEYVYVWADGIHVNVRLRQAPFKYGLDTTNDGFRLK
jgi:transposase-like protein